MLPGPFGIGIGEPGAFANSDVCVCVKAKLLKLQETKNNNAAGKKANKDRRMAEYTIYSRDQQRYL